MKIYRIQPMAGPYEGNVFYCERLEDLATALETAGDACLVSVMFCKAVSEVRTNGQ